MNHTPGPWTIGKYHVNAYDNTIYDAKNGYKIAIVEGYTHDLKEESEANAHLIAAAPELLEALKGLIGWHDCFPMKEGEADLPVIATARAAIAKAEGGA